MSTACEHSNVRSEDGARYCVDCGHAVERPPRAAVSELAALVASEIAERLAQDRDLPEPWIDARAAAEHLSCKVHRIHDLSSRAERNGFPVHREGNRLLFRRSELDEYVERRNGA